jgi:hypothetical protein
MIKTKVVYMAAVKDLLAEWEKIRRDILAGEVQGWGGSIKFTDGEEVVYIGGTFRTNAADRARCMLKVSAVRATREGQPLTLRNIAT